jgi:hypothetical protein
VDIWEAMPTWETNLDVARHYAFQVMEYIWTSIPCLLALQPLRFLLEATRRRLLLSFVVVLGRGQGELLCLVTPLAFPLEEPCPIFVH